MIDPFRPGRLAFALTAALILSGCALDPFTRDGNWRPSGAAEANLRIMVADPRDYQQGAAERGSDGQLGADAVQRLRAARGGQNGGATPQLPTVSSASGTGSGS